MPKKPSLSEIDIHASRYVSSLRLTPEERIFLATAARNNSLSEAEVLHTGLRLLRKLGELGLNENIVINPFKEDDIKSVILLDMDPANAIFTIEDFQDLSRDEIVQD